MADPRIKKKMHTHTDRVTPLICHCALAPTRARRERIRLGSPFPVGFLRAMKLPGCHSNWLDWRTIGPITWHLSARRCCHRAQLRPVSRYTFSFRSSRKGLARRGTPRGSAVFRQATIVAFLHNEKQARSPPVATHDTAVEAALVQQRGGDRSRMLLN